LQRRRHHRRNRQPQRLDRQHRRHLQRDQDGDGADAASGKCNRADVRRLRRKGTVRGPGRGAVVTIASEKNPPVKLPNEPVITRQIVAEHGLAPDEYERLLRIMGREPTMVELGIFSAMWSEHCSYKSSKVWLKKLPTSAPWVIQGPGENAGVIDIGD